MPANKILSHIKWSESLEEPYVENAIERADLLPHPELVSNNFRRSMFAEAIDEAVQSAARKLYPDFFTHADALAISKYDDLLMQSVNKLINQLDDFFFKDSEAKK